MEFIHPEGWARARGYANGTVTHGRLLHIAGQIGWNSQQVFETDDFLAQFDQTLGNVAAVLAAAGGRPEDLAELTVYVTDLPAYRAAAPGLGPVWRKHFGRHYPAMALVGVAGLVEPRAQVEMQGRAVLSDS